MESCRNRKLVAFACEQAVKKSKAFRLRTNRKLQIANLKSISIRRNQSIGDALTRRDGVDWGIIFREMLSLCKFIELK